MRWRLTPRSLKTSACDCTRTSADVAYFLRRKAEADALQP
jgi:hypothetical protein